MRGGLFGYILGPIIYHVFADKILRLVKHLWIRPLSEHSAPLMTRVKEVVK
jgi:hypothetical protein